MVLQNDTRRFLFEGGAVVIVTLPSKEVFATVVDAENGFGTGSRLDEFLFLSFIPT